MFTFISAIVYTVASLILGGWVGTLFAIPFLSGVWIEANTGILEISMSADNAVVISGMLRKQTPFWQRNYMIFGMLFAVFGMRFLMPLFMVSISDMISPWSTLMMAIHNPDEYSKSLLSSGPYITAFGIGFLTMVFADFMLDDEKDHWIGFIESKISEYNEKKHQYTLGLLMVLIASCVYRGFIDPGREQITIFMLAGLLGIGSHYVIKLISSYGESSSENGGSGFMGFLAMEAVDASFSFDGVIGAFAITKNIFLVAIGLGIGAIWTRTLVKLMASNKTVAEMKFLGHGAFWNIFALIVIMIIGIAVEVPVWIPGVFSVILLGKAIYDSYQALKA